MDDRYNTFALTGRLLYYIFIYPRCRFACLGLCTLRACPFRACVVLLLLFIQCANVSHCVYPFTTLLFFTIVIINNNGGLKAQCLSIAQGKRSGALGKRWYAITPAPCKGKSPKPISFCLVWMMNIILLPLQGVYRLLHLYIPTVPLRLPWAMNAPRLPLQGVCWLLMYP